MCIKTFQWFNDVIQLLALPEVLEAQYKLFSVPPRKSKVQRSMAHTQYESYMTHLVTPFINIQPSTEWTHHSNIGTWLICSNYATQLYSDSQKETPDGQPWRTEVYWESQSGLAISPWVDVLACNFIQLRNIYLSHNVNTHVEQRQEEMNSPVPQHTCIILYPTHTEKHTHTI